MIKEIEKPQNFSNYFHESNSLKLNYFFNEQTKEYFCRATPYINDIKCDYIDYYFYLNQEMYYKSIWKSGSTFYNNRNKLLHRLDGPAAIYYVDNNYKGRVFFLNGKMCNSLAIFAKLTKQLICKICNNFCNQNCF